MSDVYVACCFYVESGAGLVCEILMLTVGRCFNGWLASAIARFRAGKRIEIIMILL